MFTLNNDKELFKKCREIWNNIDDDDDDEFIAPNVHNNTNFVEGDYRNKLVMVLHYVIGNYPKTSLIQVKTHKGI